jgi:hypothetical protein
LLKKAFYFSRRRRAFVCFNQEFFQSFPSAAPESAQGPADRAAKTPRRPDGLSQADPAIPTGGGRIVCPWVWNTKEKYYFFYEIYKFDK